jgi:transcription initiation factor TFIID subunit 6
VEYRLHLILQEAKKFMVHGKRQTLLPEDVEHAMEALNVEVSDTAFWTRQG